MENNYSSQNTKSPQGKNQSAFIKIALLIAVIAIVIYAVYWYFTRSGSAGFTFSMSPLKQQDGKINVLLLGNAGGSHDGASLTDTIIVASYDLKTNHAILFSLPRDLWLDNPGAKVNTVYQVGKKETGNGLKYAEDKIGGIMGLPISYGVRLDFEGFSKAVDLVDGVDVDVPKTFDDFNYPIEGKEDDTCGLTEKEVEMTTDQFYGLKLPSDTPSSPGSDGKKKYKVLVGENDKIATDSADFFCRYEHIHFDQGKMHMDGTTALKFVRSRHGTNGEGSDFGRSRRQQAVLEAFRQKVLSAETLLDPKKLYGLAQTFGESFETDIEQNKFLDFYNLSKKLDVTDHIVLGDLGKGESLFVVGAPSNYGGAFVLIPKDGSTTITDFVKQKLEATPSASISPAAK